MSLRQLRKLEQHRRSFKSPTDQTWEAASLKDVGGDSNEATSGSVLRKAADSYGISLTRGGRSAFSIAANVMTSSSCTSSSENSEDEGPGSSSPHKQLDKATKLPPVCSVVHVDRTNAQIPPKKSRHLTKKPRKAQKRTDDLTERPTSGHASEAVGAKEETVGATAYSVAATCIPASPGQQMKAENGTGLARSCLTTCLAMKRSMFDVEAAIRKTFGRGVFRESQSGGKAINVRV